MYVLSSDKRIIEQCRRRREVEQEHNYYVSTIAAQKAQLAEKDNQLAEKDALIAELKAQLAKDK
jgi:transcription initiation factor IIE alpha subunit